MLTLQLLANMNAITISRFVIDINDFARKNGTIKFGKEAELQGNQALHLHSHSAGQVQ